MDIKYFYGKKKGQYDITVKYTGNTITKISFYVAIVTLIGASAWYIKKYHYNN